MALFEPNSKEEKRLGKRKTHENKEKKARRIQRELNKVWEAEKNLGFIELDKPIQQGFVKYFTLRPDISRSPWAEQIKRILKVINTHIRCRNEKFKYYDKQKKKMVDMIFHTRIIRKEEFERCIKEGKLKEEDAKYFYFTVRTMNYHTSWQSYEIHECFFNREWMLKPKIDKYYITKKPIHDSELRAKSKYLSKKMWGKQEFLAKYIYNNLNCWKYEAMEGKERAIREFLDNKFKEEIDD